MKKLIMSFSVLCAIIATISFIPFSAVADGDDEEIIVKTKEGKGDGGDGGPRGLDVPIVAAYNESAHLVSVSFLSNLGIVDVDIENEDAGVSSSYQVNSAIGYHSFVISGATGLWTITFTLSDGTEYIGEWTIN